MSVHVAFIGQNEILPIGHYCLAQPLNPTLFLNPCGSAQSCCQGKG